MVSGSEFWHPQLKLQEREFQIKKLERPQAEVLTAPAEVGGTQLWFTVNPDGEIDEFTAHHQADGAKALLVSAKSRRHVGVCQWHEFEQYGWTCQEFILIPRPAKL